ncbi:MAG: glycosyltransferase 87 family protein [Actinomycetota bacterium]
MDESQGVAWPRALLALGARARDGVVAAAQVHPVLRLLPLAVVTAVVAVRNRLGLDILQEHAVARAVLERGNPYLPLNQLAPDLSAFPWTLPRLPGALLLGVPAGLVDHRSLIVVMTVANALIVLWLVPSRYWMFAPLLFASQPLLESLRTGNTAVLAAALIVATWRGRSGVWLGLAATLRLFPLAFVLPLWIGGRRRSAVEAISVFFLINGAGLLHPSITLEGTVDSLRQGGLFLAGPANVSIAGQLVDFGLTEAGAYWLSGLFVLAIVGWLVWRRPAWEQGLGVTVPGVLLALPVAWAPYLTMAAPAFLAVPATVSLWFLPRLGIDNFVLTVSLAWAAASGLRRQMKDGRPAG